MKFLVRFFTDPDTARIRVRDVETSPARAAAIFERDGSSTKPKLVEKLLRIKGIVRVSLGSAANELYVTVTKRTDTGWHNLLTRVLSTLASTLDPQPS